MNKMVVTGLESKMTVFDLRTRHPTKGFASLTEKVCVGVYMYVGGVFGILIQINKANTVWSVKHLPQNRDIFMTSGGNGSLHLWK